MPLNRNAANGSIKRDNSTGGLWTPFSGYNNADACCCVCTTAPNVSTCTTYPGSTIESFPSYYRLTASGITINLNTCVGALNDTFNFKQTAVLSTINTSAYLQKAGGVWFLDGPSADGDYAFYRCRIPLSKIATYGKYEVPAHGVVLCTTPMTADLVMTWALTVGYSVVTGDTTLSVSLGAIGDADTQTAAPGGFTDTLFFNSGNAVNYFATSSLSNTFHGTPTAQSKTISNSLTTNTTPGKNGTVTVTPCNLI